ncbi:hypothetical protein PR202_ga08306 [Eleusine coracana subsp. coracana]|uniref:Alanine racemase N-terminal domain-containing protein n=1 Tax=Eleusine coracana subsp. coracana TaxID=191504 RepID=A0AAV5C2A8_ELECO|nr:hypothetical protein PR202_ga08306 [Eleusine coracana subsp. coracana]
MRGAGGRQAVISVAGVRGDRGQEVKRVVGGWQRLRRRELPRRRALRAVLARAGRAEQSDIRWHFIGHLQSNKAKPLLAAVPNLDMVEGVDNEKIANHLNRAVSSLGREPLKVLVQVNTSGEESKSGVDPSRCVELAKHVKLACPHLILSGLMTIGMKHYSSTPENFEALVNCKVQVCKALGIPTEQFELSMGMSGDFEKARGRDSLLGGSYALNMRILLLLGGYGIWDGRMEGNDRRQKGLCPGKASTFGFRQSVNVATSGGVVRGGYQCAG